LKPKITGDILPSIIVFLVALPLCMGIAIASGMPPASGLITGIIGGLVVGMIAGSPLQVSGPAAGLAVLVAQIVQDFGPQALGPLLIIAGAIQIGAGLIKAGQWFRAISPAVIYGMLSGIGILIFASQCHVMLDDKPQSNGIKNLITIPNAIFRDFFGPEGPGQHIPAVLGVFTIVTLVLWNRFRPKALQMIPGALIGVVLATIAAMVIDAKVNYVTVPANLLAAASWISVDAFSILAHKSAFVSVLTLAFVASAETLLSAGAVDRMHDGPRSDYDKELRAQGIGNILCGIAGSLPMTGVIVRSSANVLAGGKTRWSTVMHGFWILAFVVAVPFILEKVPVASLAGILVFTGYKLVDWKGAKSLSKYGLMPLWIYGVTIAGIVCFDLLTGVILGVALSFIKLVQTASQIDIWVQRSTDENRADVHISGGANFVKLPVIAQTFESIPRNITCHVHFAELVSIDHAVMDLLTNLEDEFERGGGRLVTEWDHLHARHENQIRGTQKQQEDLVEQ
jgi:MFS superfamily sulfate permease-like transporter